MPIGKFIAIEGLDGSGKTTIIERLKEGFPGIVYTREPGGSPFGEMIRAVLLDPMSKNVQALPMLLGFMAARADHYLSLILLALNNGETVISDRFDGSTYAFQLYAQQKPGLEKRFWELREDILGVKEGLFCRPNYVYLRITPDVAAERRKIRLGEATHFDLQVEEFHQRVFDGYEEFFKCIEKRARIGNTLKGSLYHVENGVSVVDADVDFDSVYDSVKKIILSLA